MNYTGVCGHDVRYCHCGKTKRTLPEGIKKRLYVNRVNAAKLQPPIIVELMETGERIHGKNVVALTQGEQIAGGIGFEFKWSGNNTDAPALWIETELELEVTL